MAYILLVLVITIATVIIARFYLRESVKISPGGQWQIGLQLVAWHGEDFSCLLASYIVL